MKRITKLFGLLALIVASCFAVAASYSGPQANSYFKDGVSFQYPSGWPLSDLSDAHAQILSLDRGENEAKILVVVLREAMSPEQLAQAQPRVTQALLDNLTQSFSQAGATPQRSSVSAAVGGTVASGVRLRAVVGGESGNADVYWLAMNGRLVHLIFVGADRELTRAMGAWTMICTTLRVGGGVAPTYPVQSANPTDLSNYTYRRLTDTRVELYMDEWGRGYVHDINNDAWVRIPDYSGRGSNHAQSMIIQIHPSFCKTSDTMALMYAFGGLLVYDSALYSAQNPGRAWVVNYEASQRPHAFASISRARVINHVAQVNDQLALAAGTNWICVYDRSLHRWVNYYAPADDSTNELDRNLVLAVSGARVKVLNGPFCDYVVGTGSWRCEGRP